MILDCYFEHVMDEMYRTATLNYVIAPTVKQTITWYEDSDGDCWYHEIPGGYTKDGRPRVVNCNTTVKPYHHERSFYTIEATFI